jgi:hypothetical protein
MKPNPRLFLALMAFICINSFAQDQPVLFRHGAVLPENNIRISFIDSFNRDVVRVHQKAFAVLQFSRQPNSSDKKILSANKIELLDYIPHQAYTVTIGSELSVPALEQAGVRSLIMPTPKMKMDDLLGRNKFPSWAVKEEGTIDVLISYARTFSLADVLSSLEQKNLQVISLAHQEFRIIGARIGQSDLNKLASLPFVEYVQAAPPQDQPLNSNSLFGSRANVLQSSIANGGRNLTGEGVVVGVGDNADIQTHADFAGRTINRNPYWAAGHGHHVAGTVGGAGNLYELYKGFAPKSTIITQSFSSIFTNASSYVQDHGMVITNNSYGNIIECDYHGTYDLLSRTLDQMAFDLPHLVNVFAAGNSGHTTCPPYAPGYKTVLGSYQSSKNVITVGATNDSGVLAFFSSRGPLRDGRIKPEITAMGQAVISAWPTNIYSFNNGTSMAAPAVSGGLALLYQRYRQLHNGADPKNGLMKALLTNGAVDKGNAGPDHQNGFGWMNLLRSVEMLEKNQYFVGTVSQGAQNSHVITVPANTSQLKVMLYWNDPAGSMLSSRILVNDLDLQLLGASQSVNLPRILDTAMNNLGNLAVTGVDRINNLEQVLLDQPAAGNYTIRINGTSINQNNSQEYFIVWDAVPVQLKLSHPVEGTVVLPSIQTKINWDAYGFSSGLVDLDLSLDDGNSWNSIATGIDINRPTYSWWPPAQAAEKARVRITKQGTGETSVSGAFTILGIPTITLDPVQCEGYARINWTTVPGAGSYQVMQLIGDEMKVVSTVTGNSYVFSGLSKDSLYFLTVRPMINGRTGLRASAVSRKPDSGTCSGNISDNDLKLESIVSPVSGRKNTSTEPATASVVSVRIKNFDDAPATGFEIKYSINGGAWISETMNTAIAAGSFYDHSFAATANVFAPGEYMITAVVNNLTADPVKKNDTATMLVKILRNEPLVLTTAFIDNMESATPAVYQRDILGLNGLSRYDFSGTTSIKRLRTFINSGIAHSGSKALTLDADRYSTAGNTNYLYGTFNLSGYDVNSNDLRLDFMFHNHGQKDHAENKVWIRGKDSDNWIEVFDLSSQQADPGTYKKSSSIELSRRLVQAGQDFSSSFQVRWGQQGITAATERLAAAGYSFDDLRLYQVMNDMQLISLDAPMEASCSPGNAETVRITVRNSSNNSLNNIPVRYRINNGNWITENISSIAGNGNMQYSFTAKADLSATGIYVIQALVDLPSDNFKENDTLTITVRSLPLITNFPYLQNFEQNDGSWYSGGLRSSWAYGIPSSNKVKRAASGTKAWKTALTRSHNAKELSYLYSPCFNTSGLANPTLSFSISLDIEDCGTTLCDAAWVEYSVDGINWQKLGSQGTGTNWYNKSGAQVWSLQNATTWKVATALLPVGVNRLRLRFVFQSDEGVEREGIAIDDIHIYDNIKGIYDGITMSSASSAVVSGNNWVDIEKDGKLLVSINPGNQNLGNTAVQAFIFNGSIRYSNNQYYHNRNITIKPSVKSFQDSVKVRFYFLESETDTLLKATGCSDCSKPLSAYHLGVSKYSDIDPGFENGTITDNQQGMWSFIRSNDVAIVPFDKGYYAEFKINDFSEFWLSNGGFESIAPLPVKMMNFSAQRTGADVSVKWQVAAETGIDKYEIELAKGNENMVAGNFITTGIVNSIGNTSLVRNYEFTDAEPSKSGTRFYRLKVIQENGSFFYSAVRSVVFGEANLWQVYPNPSQGQFFLMLEAKLNETVLANVYDAKGRLVKTIQARGTGSVQKMDINLSGMAAGAYLLSISAEGKTQSFRLYKQ